MTKIKICGLRRLEDIEAVNLAEPDYIGFVFTTSPRKISVHQAAVLREKLKPGIKAVGVFMNESADEIMGIVKTGVIDVIQLHGQVDHRMVAELKRQSRHPVIQAIALTQRKDLEQARDSEADYLLFDYRKGGSGQTFNWDLLKEHITLKQPIFIAGGIRVENVSEAIKRFSPYGVDVSSGVEENGWKQKEKIVEIVRRVRNV